MAKSKTTIKKRIYTNRFYRLPDGKPFLCYDKYDKTSMIGKVDTGRTVHGGQLVLANKIVTRSTLEKCELIPKDQEPFKIGL